MTRHCCELKPDDCPTQQEERETVLGATEACSSRSAVVWLAILVPASSYTILGDNFPSFSKPARSKQLI